MTTVFIRCDGGTHIGMGHVVRCLALASMIDKYYRIEFIIQETEPLVYKWIKELGFHCETLPKTNDFTVDCENFIRAIETKGVNRQVVVLDGYNFQEAYQRKIKEAQHTLIAIDDLHQWRQYADIVINHSEGVSENSYSHESYTKFLLGYDYLLIRQIFYQSERKTFTISLNSIILSFGASDEQNLTLRFAQWVMEKHPHIKINMLVSSINPHIEKLNEFAAQNAQISIHSNIDANEIIQLFQTNDLLICPASSIALEACAVGISVLTGTTAPNQFDNCTALEAAGAAINLGDLTACSKSNFLDTLDYLCLNMPVINEQLSAQMKIIDGNAPQRILSELRALLG
jgi:UDP-2,4-diacetamido-2,4,6-trideoxy-beta-L-altropyranose hydrolase